MTKKEGAWSSKAIGSGRQIGRQIGSAAPESNCTRDSVAPTGHDGRDVTDPQAAEQEAAQ